MSGPLLIVVRGEPQPQGSKSAFAVRRKDGGGNWQYTGRVALAEGRRGPARDAHKSWRALVTEAALASMGEAEAAHTGDFPLDGPVAIRVTFTVKRPKGHYGTGRNAGLLRAGAPERSVTRPDGGKYQRAVEDSLKDAGVYGDDSQVAEWHGAKWYTLPPHAAEFVCTHDDVGPMTFTGPADVLQVPGAVVRVWQL